MKMQALQSLNGLYDGYSFIFPLSTQSAFFHPFSSNSKFDKRAQSKSLSNSDAFCDFDPDFEVIGQI